MAFPPPGHPHYMPEAEREALANPTVELDEEPIDTTSSVAKKKYIALRKKIADAKKTMEETAKGLFTEMTADLFADNPTLVSFGWNQYTPFWNDGDVCTFSCNGDYPKVSIMADGHLMGYSVDRDELEIDGKKVEGAEDLIRTFQSMHVDSFSKNGKSYTYDAKTKEVTADGVRVKSYEDYHKMFKPLERKVSAFMKNFEDEDMQIMFGDHVAVVVNRDGTVTTEEYEHE